MRIVSGISSHTETPKNLMENRRVFVRAKMRRSFENILSNLCVTFKTCGEHLNK